MQCNIKGVKVINGASPIFSTFFKLLEILLSQESSYFSDNSRKILQLESVPFGRC